MKLLSVRVATASGIVAALLGLLTANTANTASGATPSDDVLWYYNLLGYQAIHDSGITGEGVTIAVIDSPVNLDVPTLQGADLRVQESPCLDESGNPRPGTTTDVALGQHGTNVVSYIAGSGAGYEGQSGVKGVSPGVTVLTYAVYLESEGGCPGTDTPSEEEDSRISAATGLAMQAAIDAGADVISVSMSGGYEEAQAAAMISAIHAGVIVVGSLANRELEGSGLDGSPAVMNGAVPVLAAQPSGELALGFDDLPNDSDFVVVLAPGSGVLWQGSDTDWMAQRSEAGTSIATPIVAGTFALLLEKYPDATGHQAIQSLIHNTGSGSHEPEWDPVYGYGALAPGTLLAVDPAQYPDVNPLIDDPNRTAAGPFRPLVEEIYPNGVPTTTEPTPVPTDSATSDEPSSSNIGLIALLGGVGLLVLIFVIVAIVVTVTRKKSE